MGDVTISPSNPNIVWVGTGNGFTSRSSYAGDGVYKSIDAGKTWTGMDLCDSQHLRRIVIGSRNPDVVYVVSIGHVYSEDAERGVFKTTDGGKSWQKVLYIDEKVGIIDLVINPKNPDVLYTAAHDETRLPWRIIDGGPGSGITGPQMWDSTGRGSGAAYPEGRSAGSDSTSTSGTRRSSTR